MSSLIRSQSHTRRPRRGQIYLPQRYRKQFFISRIEQKFREIESKFNNLLFYTGSSFAISMPNETTDELDADANEVPMRRNPRSSNCKYLLTSGQGQLMEFRVF